MNNFNLVRGDTATIRGTYSDVETLTDYTYKLHIDDAIDGSPIIEIDGEDYDQENKYVYFYITHDISKTLTKNRYYVQAKRYDSLMNLVNSEPKKPAIMTILSPVKTL